jgi:prepilin-type N-terminal cleavage/methylation domain-containing protein
MSTFQRHTSSGMTLIEMLVSITVFVFAMTSIVATVRSFYRTNTYAVASLLFQLNE